MTTKKDVHAHFENGVLNVEATYLFSHTKISVATQVPEKEASAMTSKEIQEVAARTAVSALQAMLNDA